MFRARFPFRPNSRALVRGLVIGWSVLFAADAARSQTQGPIVIPDNVRQQIQQMQQGGDLGTSTYQEPQQATVLKPNLPGAYLIPPGPLEQSYSKRAGVDLREFGYESFGRPSSISVRQTGALQDSYVLGTGDQVIVDVRGQESQTYRTTVNRDGNVILPRVQPIPAAGRRFGDFKRDVEQRVGEAFVATQAYVSIGNVRQIAVFVAGEVNAPGSITLNALNSPIDALLLAGGIKKSGSLRSIVIQRGDKRIPVDLYGVLAGLKVPMEANLADGDKIIVPPIGRTIAIVGEVARPGIYELGAGSAAIGTRQLVDLAGGYLVGGAKRLSVLRVRPDGSEAFEPGGTEASTSVHASEVLFVLASTNVARGRVALEGQVRIPGTYDLTRTSSLHALLTSGDVLEEDPFVLFAVISRKDPSSLARTLIPFAPIQVIRGEVNIDLKDDDVVRIFSTKEIRQLIDRLAAERVSTDLGNQDLRALRSARPQQQNDQQGQTANQPAESQGTVGAALAGQTQQLGQIGTSQQYQYQNQNQYPYQQLQQPQYQQMPDGTIRQIPAQPYLGPYQQPAGATNDQGQSDTFTDDGSNLLQPVQQGIYPGMVRQTPAKNKELTSRNLIVDLRNPAVRNQLSNFRASILGAVQVPGDYLVAPGIGLDSVVSAVGGMTTTADLTSIEITTTAFDNAAGMAKTSRTKFNVGKDALGKIKVHPGDVVRFRELFSDQDGGQVIVRGQVRFPGRFDILRGERLSSVLARAGGITEIGYPYGAVFTRRSAARAEEDGYRRAAQELERQFTVIVADTQNVSPQGIQFIRDTIDRLQTAEGVGRISVEADPVKLAARHERDTILEPDDFLFLPRRPNSVSVTGEVLSAGSYLFSSGRGGRYYIDLAGGYGQAADRGRTFVLMPDGTAQPLSGSLFSFGSAEVVPGATVIVPRNLRPFRFRNFVIDFSQVLSQLAVSAASIAVVSRTN